MPLGYSDSFLHVPVFPVSIPTVSGSVVLCLCVLGSLVPIHVTLACSVPYLHVPGSPVPVAVCVPVPIALGFPVGVSQSLSPLHQDPWCPACVLQCPHPYGSGVPCPPPVHAWVPAPSFCSVGIPNPFFVYAGSLVPILMPSGSQVPCLHVQGPLSPFQCLQGPQSPACKHKTSFSPFPCHWCPQSLPCMDRASLSPFPFPWGSSAFPACAGLPSSCAVGVLSPSVCQLSLSLFLWLWGPHSLPPPSPSLHVCSGGPLMGMS